MGNRSGNERSAAGHSELSAPDAQLLGFMAEHRFLAFAHAQSLLQVSPARVWPRLRWLEARGYIRREQPFGGKRSFFLITAQGLRSAGSRLRAPRFHLGAYEHDLGAAWLWLAAQAGAFGPLTRAVSERTMRSQDATAPPGGEPLAVRLPGPGAAGRARLHYPDLLLITAEGKRIAIELELSAKGATRRERILGSYAADARIDAVLYLVSNPRLGRTIARSAERMGIEHLVRVQLATLSDPPASREGERVAQRPGLHVGRRAPAERELAQ